MVFCVVFVFVCTMVFAVNGQHDNKYEDLYNEVHNLKSFIFKINEELDNFKKQYDEVRKELQDVRSKPWLMDTRTSMKLQKDYQDENEEYGDSNTLNKRAAIVPTSSHHWNASTASTPSCQCLNGSKGEKGESGLPGPKGDTGNTGPRGDTGAQGPTGRRGHTGPAGSTGPKGEKGSIGGTGPHGPKGIQGSAGLNGIPGLKGEPGPPGLPGLKGEPAAHSHQVAFSASSKLTINQGNQVIHHTHTITNVGHDYSRSTGVFTCDVDGIYVFTWSLEVTQGQNVTSRIDVDATTSGYPLEARTTNLLNSGSRTITARLARGQTVQIITSSHDNNVCSVTCNFSGFLLS